jgi:hypothetical protein
VIDEEAFPADFDVAEQHRRGTTADPHNVDHMTFGMGNPQLRLGNNQARMEVPRIFEELLPEVKDIVLTTRVGRVIRR